jgi:hypothetical protein
VPSKQTGIQLGINLKDFLFRANCFPSRTRSHSPDYEISRILPWK